MKKAVITVVLTIALVGAIIGAIGYAGSKSDSSSGDRSGSSTTSTTLTAAQQAEKAESSAWEDEATKAFGGQDLATAVHDLIQGIDDWKAGKKPTDQAANEVNLHLQTFVAGRDALAKLRPYPRDPDPQHPVVNRLYMRSAEMYVVVARLYQVMLTLPAGQLRDQEETLARRVRELADRVFDRGRAIVLPHLFEEKPENVQVNLPEEVPKWSAEGELPGPPLDDPPPPADRFPPTHADTRPTQARDKWLAALTKTNVPSANDLAAAITAADAERLKGLGRAYVAATEAMRNEPDPSDAGGREESATVRIGLLIDADAARSAQVATFLSDPLSRDRLVASAKRLALIGDELWVRDLPPRSTGFDVGLLTTDGP